MVRSYQEAVDYLYKNLPMFQRVGSAAFKPSLSNTISLCRSLGNPETKFRSIHVAGTNGKGSTSHMLASILQSSGFKVGLYTSPHLKEFTERIRINGADVEKDFVVGFVNRISPMVEQIQPSFFEITVAMAFDYFARNRVDFAVVEVGLGGRLDSTNVITPVLSVITNIGWDHKDILGDTLEKIAFEKAGIIKPGVPVVVSEKQSHSEDAFRQRASEAGAPLTYASDTYSVKVEGEGPATVITISRKGQVIFEGLKFPLGGAYQRKNLPGVLASIEQLRKSGIPIPDEGIRHGLVHVIFQTKLKGRWQKLRSHPTVICDTGHNIDGITEVVSQINQQQFDRLHMVLGVVKDKDVSPILQLLPVNATYYFCEAKIPRALAAEQLAEKAAAFGLHGLVYKDVNEALRSALKAAGKNDFIFVGGSTFVVAEIDGL